MAGRIPEKFIDELLARVDIVDVIDARVPLKKAGKNFKACCPFHDEKTPSFTVSSDKQFYHCFGCGAHGSAIGFLMEYERMSFPEAVEDLARRAGIEVPREARPAGTAEAPDATAAIHKALADADQCFRRWLREHPFAREAVEYLRRRGLTGEIAAEFGLGFAPDGWDNLLKAAGTTEAAQAVIVLASLYPRDPILVEAGEHVDGWELVAAPGHADGQLCLLKDGVLIAADHLLGRITPTVGLWPASRADPLGDYLSALSDRTIELAPTIALPGHGDPIDDPAARARELQEHHRSRLEETVAALGSEPRTGYDLSFDLFGSNLQPAGRRFAVAETLSHAERLVHEGAARRHEDAGTVTYTAG